MDIKRKNKSYDKRKLVITINKKKYYVEPCFGWYSVSTTNLEIRTIIRDVVMDNLYWLLGRDCDIEDWERRINRWDSGRGIYNTPVDKPTSIFFNTEEKDRALNSFYK
jgi:hypothetical protein